MFLPPTESESVEDDDFPDDPEQGIAYLDALRNIMIDKGLIDESDLPPPLPGVKREDYSSQMNSQTRKRLYRDLARARQDVDRIQREIGKLGEESGESEAHDPEPGYGVEDEAHATPLMGRIAAGPPLDTERWPDQWRMVRLCRGEGPNTHFLLEVTGASMTQAGIPDGSLILIQRAEEGSPGQIVVAHEPDEGVTLKRLQERHGRLMLLWQDGSGRSRELTEQTRIQGVFVRVLGEVL